MNIFKKGDVVEYLEFYRQGKTFIVEKQEEDVVYYKDDTWDYACTLQLVVNNTEKKIIGYRLLGNTPDVPKGTIFTLINGKYRAPLNTLKEDVCYYKERVVQDKFWFEPVYGVIKPTEIFVETLAGKVKVTKNRVSYENVSMNIVQVERVFEILSRVNHTVGNYSVLVNTFDLGCTTFSVLDIPKLQEAIKQVTD